MEILETNPFYTPIIGYNQRKSLMLDDSLKAMDKNQKVFIVGICGGQGGGKTKLATYLREKIKHSAIIEERNFFKQAKVKRKLTYGDGLLMGKFGDFSEERKLLLVELSNPSSYDYKKLYTTLTNLINGKTAKIRKFDDMEGKYTGEEIEINPNNVTVIILEGYFIFRDEKVRDLINLKIFNEIDDDVRLSRLVRNENKFLQNIPIAFKHFFLIYEKYIKYAYEKYIYPTKKQAKIILSICDIKDNDDYKVIEEDETILILINNLNIVVDKKIKNKNK